MYNPTKIDKIIGKNLKRIRTERGLTQDKLGEMIGVDGVVIAQIEGAILGMGKKIMSRLCNALQIEPHEFFLTETAEMPMSAIEKEIIYIVREAEALGVAEHIARYGKFIVAETKKEKKTSIRESRKARNKTN